MRPERRNFYRILHLQPDASSEVVRSNFVALMHKLRLHPDLGGDHWNASLLSEAYGTLSNPALRAEYDRELLARYDVAALGQGRGDGRRSRSPSGPAPENRRNYYRVLEVQREAPLAVIEASHRVLRRQAQAEGQATDLLDEAFDLLSDDAERKRYDELLESCGGHLEALAELTRGSGYVPLITRFCAFCKTPHERTLESPDRDCGECRSPLFPPPEKLLNLARRAVARVQRKGRLHLYRLWPSAALRAQLVNVSPTGMRFSSVSAFYEGDVIKIDAHDFHAVGRVAHRHSGWLSNETGVEFLCASFRATVGAFVSRSL